MSFIDHIIDFLAAEDVIDLYFILSDLVEINLTEAEIAETAEYDSTALAIENEGHSQKRRTPLGKLVL